MIVFYGISINEFNQYLYYADNKKKEEMLLKTLVIYDSLGGNTEKVAIRIYETLKNIGIETNLAKISPELAIDIYDYDLVFIGSPVIQWLPTKKMMNWVKKIFRTYGENGFVLPAAPLRPGKFAISFCTYAGPHMGKQEAIPVVKWFSAFMGHLGYFVFDEWYIVGEFHNNDVMSTNGLLGNIKGRPDEHDLKEVENRVKGILASLKAWNL